MAKKPATKAAREDQPAETFTIEPADKVVFENSTFATKSDETPEAQPTIRAKKQAAEEQFAKADEAGEVRVRLAATGF